MSRSPPAEGLLAVGYALLDQLLALLLLPPLGWLAWAGSAAVWLDRFNPRALRWRVNGGLALYALAALGFAAYASRLDPRVWAGVVASGEAASVVAQGRSFLNTVAV